jgi:uncharacterized protein YdeI (BOF family)
MRKLIIAAAALALLSSPVLAQDKSGTSTAPGATSSDTMSKGKMSKMSKSKKKSAKMSKSSKKGADEQKQ